MSEVYFERNVSLVYKIFNWQSYSLFLYVPSPLDLACPFTASICVFHIYKSYLSDILGQTEGVGGGSGRQSENVLFSDFFFN